MGYTLIQKTNENCYQIPCLLLSYTNNGSGFIGNMFTSMFDRRPNKILLYFHQNAEDVGYLYASKILSIMQSELGSKFNLKILAVEYPGYGIFTNEIRNNKQTSKILSCQTKWIKENTVKTYEHCIKSLENGGLGYKPNDVIIVGSSIGTGPATHLANIYHDTYALILISPYTSIKNVAQEHGSFFGNLVEDHFNNAQAIKGVKCPTCFIHGDKDVVIPWQHSQKLFHTLLIE